MNRFTPLALRFQLSVDAFELGITVGTSSLAVISFVHAISFRIFNPVKGADLPAYLAQDGAFSLSIFHHPYPRLRQAEL